LCFIVHLRSFFGQIGILRLVCGSHFFRKARKVIDDLTAIAGEATASNIIP